jgi:methionyl-tRNA formyltransferase
MHNILVIGAVQTTAVTIEKLVEHNFNIVGVLGQEPKNKARVSGLADLAGIAAKHNLDYRGFKLINHEKHVEWATNKKPDIIFAVGFSQLLHDVWLQMPTLGCIGFHPTKLPKGRGRAPIAWITLEQQMGSASFFLMGKGADDGPIFSQSLFEVEENDDAGSVEEKIRIHIHKALDNWLPELKKGHWNPEPQDHALASWYGKRAPEDGWINWNNTANYLNRLIKASSKPHPGAYTYFKDSKIIIWKSELENDLQIKGVVGRVLLTDEEKGHLIQCGEGLLWIQQLELETETNLKVGDKLGYNIEDELYKIKKRLKNEA